MESQTNDDAANVAVMKQLRSSLMPGMTRQGSALAETKKPSNEVMAKECSALPMDFLRLAALQELTDTEPERQSDVSNRRRNYPRPCVQLIVGSDDLPILLEKRLQLINLYLRLSSR